MKLKKPQIVFFLIFLAGAAISAGLIFSSLPSSLGKILLRPFVSLGSTMARMPKFFETRDELRRKNGELRQAILRLAVNQAELDRLRAELASLTELSGYTKEEILNTATARVIGITRDPFRSALAIDRGSEDGISKGDTVIIGNGIFVGRVEGTEETRATVLLARDRKSKIFGRISGREDAVGLLEGHGVVYRLALIPREAEFEVNDVVLADPSGAGLREFVAGTVTGIEDDPKSPFRTAIVEPFARIGEFKFVGVVID